MTDLENKYPTPKQLLNCLYSRPDYDGNTVDKFSVFDNYHCTCHGRSVAIRYADRLFQICFRGFVPRDFTPHRKSDLYARYNNSWSLYDVSTNLDLARKKYCELATLMLNTPPEPDSVNIIAKVFS